MTATKNPMLRTDFYKTGHAPQYPEGTEYIYSVWVPRSNKYMPYTDGVVSWGIQGMIKEDLMEAFEQHFFNLPELVAVRQYTRILEYSLGKDKADGSRIAELHRLGYLPVRIKAVKEGTVVPLRTPMMTIENTHDDFFWVTNFLETIISNQLWQAMTSATIAYNYRKIMNEFAEVTMEDPELVKWLLHDFSMRGMGSLQTTEKSGSGHLLSFVGTDSIPAIVYLEEYYNANVETELVAGSVSATEHSVMCASADVNLDEEETFRRLLTEVYPTGIVSVVSDSFDFWDNVSRVLPNLKDVIEGRDGKLVIRPDSGVPEDILCGDPNADNEWARMGLVASLAKIFGFTVNSKGYKVLPPCIGAIYGDSITYERMQEIYSRLVAAGFSIENVVLGVGSYTYAYNTRDSLGFAMKATWAQINGEEKLIQKDPKTDDGTKKSNKGRVAVVEKDGKIVTIDNISINDEPIEGDLLETVFEDGKLVREQSLQEVRDILSSFTK
ncbi:nicotinamide phosphoribosyl transferase [Bacillus phage W.Ph.]|uniref:Nicotinamide phosphoribosyltransferase n=1 Tax=Bacillus phage W.Ph. TaxID=764595 RepID=G9B207_9CAUD|nr:nicotinamide phosphoribosyl transferase [Bacillus phage W.Ph.]ADH03402.1 gp256 [Bacillus phage W.Ph.]